jgi:hypothetical protein
MGPQCHKKSPRSHHVFALIVMTLSRLAVTAVFDVGTDVG